MFTMNDERQPDVLLMTREDQAIWWNLETVYVPWFNQREGEQTPEDDAIWDEIGRHAQVMAAVNL